MSNAPAVHHLAVLVGDLDRCEAFYRDVLGLPVLRRWNDDAGAPRSVWLELGGGAFLAVERALVPAMGHAPPRPGGSPGFHCVALAMAPEARASWRDRLAAAGVAIERESAFSMYFRDPEGNLVALSHFPSAAP